MKPKPEFIYADISLVLCILNRPSFTNFSGSALTQESSPTQQPIIVYQQRGQNRGEINA